MIPFTRRSFLASASLAAALKLHAETLSTIGVQLYTVRDVLPQKPAETLKAIAAIGYTEIEATSGTVAKIAPFLEQDHLKGVSLHLNPDAVFAGHEALLESGFAEAKDHGFEYVVFPYLMPQRRGGAEVFHRLAQTLNAAGRKAQSAGLKLCYHNHAFEFQPMGGTMPFEILMKETDPELLSLEMDVFWVGVAGHDPVKMLNQFAGRVALLHLKDKAKGTPVQYNESVKRTAFREVGNGTLDFPAILRAAKTAFVKHYFVEQDATPGDPLASLKQSYDYLHTLQF